MSALNRVSVENWGKIHGGRSVNKYTISGDKLVVSVIDLGATIQRITYCGMDIIFSLPDAKKYMRFSMGCMGATVGRYAGRIANAEFELDGVEYSLTRNQGGHHLHGGKSGFNTKLWQGKPFEGESGSGVELSMVSPDGDEGYPGRLNVSACFTVTPDDTLQITYRAETDKPTIVNLTNHCYFNLSGIVAGKGPFPNNLGDNSDIELMIDSDKVAELSGAIPTGKLLDVSNTPFDFRQPKIITRDAAETEGKNGYDHSFVLNHPVIDYVSARAFSRKSKIQMECFTDQPSIQLFTMGAKGSSFALEAQHLPDSPHHPEFPSTVLRPSEKFIANTIYKFSRE